MTAGATRWVIWWSASALAAWGAIAYGADVYLGLSRSAGAKIPVAVLGVQAAPDVADAAATLRAVIESDLRRSLLFTVVTLPVQDTAKAPDAARVKEAGAAGADVVIWGRLSRERDGSLLWSGTGYDGGSGAAVVEKAYRGRDEQSARSMAHRFADAVVTGFTGEQGIAQTRIAFVSDRSGKKELYVMDYDGANVVQITRDRSAAMSPRWSPDGTLITFGSYRDGALSLHSYVPTSGRRWPVIKLPGTTMSPAWAPGGDLLAFSSSQAGDFDLYVSDADGKHPRRLTFGMGDDLSPSWSPNGAQIAFNSNRGGSPQIYLMNAQGSDQRRLTFEGTYNTAPAFSPKGNWIAYTCRVDGQEQICLIGPDGSRRVQLTTSPGPNVNPSWAPGGRHVVFESSRGGDAKLYVIGLDGSGEEALTSGNGNDQSPGWSPS
ncbi:MAG: Tol-Pal system beta propeller repeat protein TolB [Nitrospirota bacterium]